MPCYLFLIKFILLYITADKPIYEALLLIFGFAILLGFSMIFRNEHLKRAILLGALIRKSSLGFLERVLLNKTHTHDTSVAQLINITTGDLSKVDRIGAYYTYIIVAPVGIFVALGFTYGVIGWVSVVALPIILLFQFL